MTPVAYRVAVDEAVIERIRTRLAEARWAIQPTDDEGWAYGTDARWLRGFVDHWVQAYDWRAAEAALNRWPQFRVEVDGLKIHAFHVRGSSPRPRPLLLTHGWPGSVVEFLGCIERLAHPERFGGDPAEGFDLVIPSLPGYGFSQAPPRPIGPREVARLWRRLMVEGFGHAAFVAQGGDWGAAVSSWLAIDHADVVRGLHLNLVPSVAVPARSPPDAREAEYRARLKAMRAREMGYLDLQRTRPQTLALALVDSPLGFASWVCEKFQRWGDTRGDIDSRFDRDTLITNLMTYLVTDSVGTALWLYRGRAEELAAQDPQPFAKVPTGVACFPAELVPYPARELAERAYDIVRWTQMPAGGHFAALEEPAAFCDELRAFCRQIGW